MVAEVLAAREAAWLRSPTAAERPSDSSAPTIALGKPLIRGAGLGPAPLDAGATDSWPRTAGSGITHDMTDAGVNMPPVATILR